jgi:hypothetical protein
MAKHTQEQFLEAEKDWDLERLYNDLSSAKGKHLTRIEKLHLRGLLCGYSPADIAEMLHIDVRGLEVNLCNKLYQYVKKTVERENERIENWRNISQWLAEKGYRAQHTSHSNNPVDTTVHIENLSIENNKVEFDMNIQVIINTRTVAINSELTTPSSSSDSSA